MKSALITGITGQDGYYLTEFLLKNGYTVHGTVRRSSSINTSRIDGLIAEYQNDGILQLYYSDLLDSSSLYSLINKINPDEVYNLAAQSHVAVSFKNPVYSTQTGTIGPLSLLDAIKNVNNNIKYYQASSSEMYGGGTKDYLNEESPFDPKSPYAAAKVFAHNITKLYRESYNMFAVNGILFNHESPMRGETFVTRKITRAVGRISENLQSKLTLGNLEAKRDWGFAGDYVEGMIKMIEHNTPDDWVLATGEAHSVEEFAKLAFKHINLEWSDCVETSEKYERPNEVHHLLGDSSKAKKILGWEPKVSFSELVSLMVEKDIELAKQERVLVDNNLLEPTWENAIF